MRIELTVASEQPSTFETARPADLLTLDFRDPARAVARALEFAGQHPLHGVVGVDDDTAVMAAVLAQALELRGNPPDAAAAARDKYRQRVLLEAGGVPVPRFARHAFDEAPEALARRTSYPCVLKPLRLAASRGVIRASDPAEFVAAFDRLRAIVRENPDCHGELLVEDYVAGREFAVEGLLREGRLTVLAVFDKPDPLEGPYFEETIYVTPSRLPQAAQDALTRCTEDATRAMGLREGPVHAELRLDRSDQPWMIELAARPIGGRCSAVLRFTGRPGDKEESWASLEELVIRHALGMSLGPLERESQAGGVMMIPVPGSGVLREVRGVAASKAVPLVEDVVITAHPGEQLVPWPEGSRYPGFIFARGNTPAEVEAALREAHRLLHFVLET